MRPAICITGLVACATGCYGDDLAAPVAHDATVAPDAAAALSHFDVHWHPEPGCTALGTTALVMTRPARPNFDPLFWEVMDAFACETGQGRSRSLPLGAYDVAVAITDDSRHTMIALSDFTVGTLNRQGDAEVIDLTFPTTTGQFRATWTGFFPCDSLGAETVRMEAVPAGTTTSLEVEFDCDVGFGWLEGIPVGEFDYTLSAHDGAGNQAGPTFSTFAFISWGNQRRGQTRPTEPN